MGEHLRLESSCKTLWGCCRRDKHKWLSPIVGSGQIRLKAKTYSHYDHPMTHLRPKFLWSWGREWFLMCTSVRQMNRRRIYDGKPISKPTPFRRRTKCMIPSDSKPLMKIISLGACLLWMDCAIPKNLGKEGFLNTWKTHLCPKRLYASCSKYYGPQDYYVNDSHGNASRNCKVSTMAHKIIM